MGWWGTAKRIECVLACFCVMQKRYQHLLISCFISWLGCVEKPKTFLFYILFESMLHSLVLLCCMCFYIPETCVGVVSAFVRKPNFKALFVLMVCWKSGKQVLKRCCWNTCLDFVRNGLLTIFVRETIFGKTVLIHLFHLFLTVSNAN